MHWGIENALHYWLDVTFGEDASPIRLRNAVLNFAFLRRAALNLFRVAASSTPSLPKKRKKAAWSPDDLANVLQPQEI
jgi:hypothetical protein